MPDQEDLRLPLEAPEIGSTTQALQAGGPNDVSISVFFSSRAMKISPAISPMRSWSF
jgi:hypothetical protein